MSYGNTPEYKHDYYIRNRQHIAAGVRKRANSVEGKAVRDKYRKENARRIAARHMVYKARERALKSGVPFDADFIIVETVFRWVLWTPKCPACGVQFSHEKRTVGGPHRASATLDRIKPKLGYVRGNVALLCWPCNRLKSSSTFEEIVALVKWLKTAKSLK